MKLIKIFFLLLISSLTLGSCEKLLNPEDDNHNTFNRIFEEPAIAEGLLMSAYTRIPTLSLSFDDVATDDAVSNVKSNTYLLMATGQWSAIYNPASEWDNCRTAIQYANQFLTIVDTIVWSWTNPEANGLFKKRLRGEAYALRGLFQYHLLQTVGGMSNGIMLGIPPQTHFSTINDNFNVPRATFEESVTQIYADLDSALVYLTMDDYKDITIASQLPPGYTNVAPSSYTRVFGNLNNQRISGRIVKALRARVALLAASPAFTADNPLLWESAANYAAVAINNIPGTPGIAGLDPNGNKFYDQLRVNAINIATGIEQKETVWRTAIVLSNTRELNNFPPTLFGSGNINPTQNLVDAFPMANGYPITETTTPAYNPTSPYINRDPRLALYIAYNGSIMKGAEIKTGKGGGTNSKDSISTSTRTGYYMRKLLNENVNANPVGRNTMKHYEVHMRYTEIFLIYAEAANEAWGPDGMGANGFSARQVIRAIRNRAGIPLPDNYLASIGSKEDMRKLIRNERRLELCFEGFRFWDLRRWKADLTVPAKGVNINAAGTSFEVVDVEQRLYDNSYMIYGPVPKGELVKFSALQQNTGW